MIVGDGEVREELQASLSISVRTFQHTGKVAPGEVPGWLTQMDIAVAPYPVAEDFYFSPLKILEYMAAGIPVVASAVGDLPSLVEHERTGILVPPGDADALGQALLHLARHPPATPVGGTSPCAGGRPVHVAWRGRRILGHASTAAARSDSLEGVA